MEKITGMSLEIMARACGGELYRADDGVSKEEPVTVVHDSRSVQSGCLFVAIPGERVDGHRFIGSVYEQGALCVLTQKTPEQVEEEHGVSASCWGAYILVENTVEALGNIAGYYRSTLDIPVVGITGSVGKTTTKEMVASVLSQKYRVFKTQGNFNSEIGLPLSVLRIRPEDEVAVIEMGINDFGEMHRLSEVAKPTICLITNIGSCHLETLKDRDGVLRAKSEIFDCMDPQGEVCLNGDDDKLATVREVRGKKVHYYGVREKGDEVVNEVYFTDVKEQGLEGSSAFLHIPDGENVPVHIPLPGLHMVSNAAAAACVGFEMGLTGEQIAAGIANASTVGERNHVIALRDYTLIDDCYNANPVSVRAAIDLLCEADTYKIAILGDMFELGEDSVKFHRETGEYAARSGIDELVFIGTMAHEMEIGAENSNCSVKILYYPGKKEFLEDWTARKEKVLHVGSTILIKASRLMEFEEITAALRENSIV